MINCPRVLMVLALLLALAGCGSAKAPHTTTPSLHKTSALKALPKGTHNVYIDDGARDVSPVAKRAKDLVYVPNSQSNTVDVIDPKTFKIIEHFNTGGLPQHVTPAWNLKTLYVDNDGGNSLTPINPETGKPGKRIQVEDPYNLYFTPNGKYAMVIAERLRKVDFRNARTMKLTHSLPVPDCAGVDHADFSAHGRYMYLSCEFSSNMIEIDLKTQKQIASLKLPRAGAAPQDVKLSPDGRMLYVADMMANGLWEINPVSFKLVGFLPTGMGAHGIYPSRNSKYMYVSNRGEGSISVISFKTRKVVKKWQLPQPASPDMGGVSVDGSTLWLSGRYDSVVYAINTRTGKLRAKIPVGKGPHGLCVWPQPGRYSLGHTGIMR
ncbi:MAG: YncE family protein [Solirubrobacterales bacterium]|nr:YncE family protein [Solirubrobacterales bacterium]